MNVNILASCRVSELLPATTMVFRTLRVGFPSANVTVFLNEPLHADIITKEAEGVGCKVVPIPKTTHAAWLESLIASEIEPWVALDTDIVFWDCVEHIDWPPETPLAGRYVPRFFDPFTKCITIPRLHTSLLFVHPTKVKEKVAAYRDQFPSTQFNPMTNLIHPAYLPVRNAASGRLDSFFHDTCCLLYQCVGGVAFDEKRLNCFDHLNAGTISDVLAPGHPGLREDHFMCFENPSLLKGNWRNDDLWFAANRV